MTIQTQNGITIRNARIVARGTRYGDVYCICLHKAPDGRLVGRSFAAVETGRTDGAHVVNAAVVAGKDRQICSEPLEK